uniref:Uncharacterized protein n=1 Tax=Rousettus aegyptiacus TaxID=9407 RepID=A0A7J8D6G9_ROUAE|nr:hypothetical protein HJG63_008772 [Rousettus aegyptiacus]
MKGIISAEAEGVSEKGPLPTSQPMKKEPYLPSFLLPSAKSHLPHTERSSAFEVCLGEKISLKCSPWRGHEFWDLLESPEKMSQFKHTIPGQLEYKYCPKIELKEKSLALYKVSDNYGSPKKGAVTLSSGLGGCL